MKNSFIKLAVLIFVIFSFGFMGYKIANVFKKEKIKPVVNASVTKELKAKVISFQESMESILIKKEDNLENITLLINDSTIIANENGILLTRENIKLGIKVKVEIEESENNYIAKKIYIID